MPKCTLYTKQHESVLDTLEARGVYYARRAFIESDLGEHASLVLDVYDWYVRQMAKRIPKPEHAEYPVWASYERAAAMPPGPGAVLITFEVEESLVLPVNILKWGRMLNYGYIPADGEDQKQHNVLLEKEGLSDTKAYMSPFYPARKREIVESWQRLFDEGVTLGNQDAYATLWQLRRDWICTVTKSPDL